MPSSRALAASSSLEELLRAADVVTLHVPLLPATRNLIGETQLAMADGAIRWHSARHVVDRRRSRQAESGRLGSACRAYGRSSITS
ncbi:MAG: hypothetical protein KIT18_00100 [Burkholderiales bacterium]|nr:hypothetical protein [Burkholderiales bacterium]